jgi:hypothetical protein
VLVLLDTLNARAYAEKQGQEHARAALSALDATSGDKETLALLSMLVQQLSGRSS